MSAFYVGQRVRKVRGVANIGLEATVTAVGYQNWLRPEATMRVRIDRGVMGIAGWFDAGEEACTDPADWEPILPPGLESLEEINALYEPSPERVRESVR